MDFNYSSMTFKKNVTVLHYNNDFQAVNFTSANENA
jgi:hypothetical protein